MYALARAHIRPHRPRPPAVKPTGRGVPPSSPLLRLFHEKERQDEAQQRPSTAPLGQQARGLGPPPLAKEQSAPELHPHPPALARSLSTRPSMKPRQGEGGACDDA